MIKKILIFEPWGLGDVIIAVDAARHLKRHGFDVGLICNKKWVQWTKEQLGQGNVIDFWAPWTEINNKYNPLKYNIGDIFQLKTNILKFNPDLIWDARGDIRHKIFLWLLAGHKNTRITLIKYTDNLNVYNRKYKFLKEIGFENKSLDDKENDNSNKVITVFFGAQWKNRQLPVNKAKELIRALLSMNKIVNIFLQPHDDCNQFNEFNSIQVRKIKKNIVECSVIIASSDLIISTDSSWLHMAYYYGIPCIGLFGFHNAEQWAPPNCNVVYATNSLPANFRYKKSYKEIQPLKEISIEKILEIVRSYDNGI